MAPLHTASRLASSGAHRHPPPSLAFAESSSGFKQPHLRPPPRNACARLNLSVLCVFRLQECVVRVVHAYITSMVGSVDVIAQDQSLDDPLEDGACVLACVC